MPPDFQKACEEKIVQSGKETPRMASAPQESEHKPSPPEPPTHFVAGRLLLCLYPSVYRLITRGFCASGYPGWLPRQW